MKVDILIIIGARSWGFETFLEYYVWKALRRTSCFILLFWRCVWNTNALKLLDFIVTKNLIQVERKHRRGISGHPSFLHSFILEVYFEIPLSAMDPASQSFSRK